MASRETGGGNGERDGEGAADSRGRATVAAVVGGELNTLVMTQYERPPPQWLSLRPSAARSAPEGTANDDDHDNALGGGCSELLFRIELVPLAPAEPTDGAEPGHPFDGLAGGGHGEEPEFSGAPGAACAPAAGPGAHAESRGGGRR